MSPYRADPMKERRKTCPEYGGMKIKAGNFTL